MTSKVVVGKRVEPNGLPARVTWSAVAIVLVVLAVRSFILGAGVIGAVASGVASEVAVDTGIAKANRRYDSNTPSSEAELDLALRHGEMGVCDRHTSITDRGVEYGDGNLAFRSCRHYEAFCKLNAITAEATPANAEAPQARVVS